MVGGGADDPCTEMVICEDFSGTGSTGWTVLNNTWDFDATSDPFADDPGEYLAHTSVEDSVLKNIKRSHTPLSTAYGGMLIRFNALPPGSVNIVQGLNGTTSLYIIKVQTGGKLEVTHTGGTSVQESTASITAGAEVYVKWRYEAGTGNNSKISVWSSMDGVTWGSARATSSDGDNTLLENVYQFNGLYSGINSVDIRKIWVGSNDFNF